MGYPFFLEDKTDPGKPVHTIRFQKNRLDRFIHHRPAGGHFVREQFARNLFIDDAKIVRDNPYVQECQIRNILSKPYWQDDLGRGLFRPVTTLTFCANAWMGGTSPFGYHFFNLCLHAVNVLLLFFLLLRFTHTLHGSKQSGSWLALLVVLPVGVHPALVEAINSLVGRAELLVGFFVLLLAWFVVLVGVAGLFWVKKKFRWVLLCFWFFSASALMLHLIPIGIFFAERLLYLPILATACGVTWVLTEAPPVGVIWARWGVIVLLLLVTGFFSIKIYSVTPVWQNDLLFWKHTQKMAPKSLASNYNLAMAYKRRGNLEQAETFLRKNVALAPKTSKALFLWAWERSRRVSKVLNARWNTRRVRFPIESIGWSASWLQSGMTR